MSVTKAAKVEIRGLTKRFENVTALEQVDLRLEENEFVSLVGVSGCGKSTLLAAIAGLTQPTEGEVLVSGKPVSEPGRDRGVVFQRATLLPWLTAQKNVEFALRSESLTAAQRRELAREQLALVGLDGFEDVFPAQLSGGMQQRVALARSLSYRPEILLMDEPFGALDALTRRDMQELLTSVWERHRLTVLFVTHDIEEAVFISDRVVIMTPRPGRILDQAVIDLPRPRRAELVSHPHFIELSRRLLKSIRGVAPQNPVPAADATVTPQSAPVRPIPRTSLDTASTSGIGSGQAMDAAKCVNVPELNGLLRELIRSNSENPPGREAEIARLVAARLAKSGLEVELQEVEAGRMNVVALLRGESEESLLFNAHLDTVTIGDPLLWTSDPLGGDIRDGKLFGRGACDMKGGLAAMIAAIEAVVKANVPRKRSLLFAGVIDEEVWFKGMNALLLSGTLQNCSRAYVGEPTSLRIATALQGAAEFTAVVHGRSMHTGMAEKGDNAIFKMHKVIAALEEYRTALVGMGAQLGFPVDPSLNLGVITGGSGVTFVPDICKIAFDRQILPGEDKDGIIYELRQLFDETCVKHGITGELTCDQAFSPWQVDSDSPAVQALGRAQQKVSGTPAELALFRGYCEVELLSQAGIPGAIYGPGDLLQAHRPDEYVPLSEVETAARVYALAAAEFISGA